jgi:hypothetical protein
VRAFRRIQIVHRKPRSSSAYICAHRLRRSLLAFPAKECMRKSALAGSEPHDSPSSRSRREGEGSPRFCNHPLLRRGPCSPGNRPQARRIPASPRKRGFARESISDRELTNPAHKSWGDGTPINHLVRRRENNWSGSISSRPRTGRPGSGFLSVAGRFR